ncbi:Acg family FMN-binding oxidoreductase [Streptomyces silvisoli]|uniref:Nitroreductase n=1 Tax=Streptomyces silvisoli TaxID=3034235 RepID=A0ABT5ZT60_9ACTN|nr:nitroreductase family protein [Streptomyces silvisoli]MDF3292704.1 nitroreductase [Streptomyces silvisoli]
MNDAHVAELVRDATAAPSMHNAQPWRFRYSRGSGDFRLYADFDRAMPHSDPDARALHLGCGAALFNLRVAAANAGCHPDVTLLPDLGDTALLATVRLIAPRGDDVALALLHPAIHERHTSRYPFTETEIPAGLRTALTDAARQEGATLSFPSSWHLRLVEELAEDARARDLTDRDRQAELERWTRMGIAEADTATDGVPDYAFGPRQRGGRAPMRDFSGGRPTADLGSTPFENDPHLALLSTDGDRPRDWLRAGQAMERVLLLATLEGLATSFSTEALEWPDLRWPLRDPVSGTGCVHTMLRLGYGPKGPTVPRRPVRDILTIED